VSCATSNWGQNFTYDSFGNINKAVPSGYTGITFNPTYSTSPSNNRFSAIPGVNVTYDSNGNLTQDGNTYVWDSENKPTSINTTNITYDALGRAVEFGSGSSHTQIVYKPDGKSKLALMNGTSTLVTGFMPLPSGATAVYKPGVLPAYYRHRDWLGSSRLSIQPNHTKWFDSAYAPFGENYAGGRGTGGAVDLDFTGANQDTVSGLYDFLYREYHPVQGRWISPDPAGLNAVNMSSPQSWNRYAYVENNPLSRIDSFGTCDLIVAGSGESEDTVGGKAIIDYASTIGANVVFPYAGLSVEASVADIIAQGNGDTTPATVATANAYSATYSDGLLNGTGFGATAFSGGAQALTSAQALTGLLAPDEINYVSPGMGGFQRSPLKGGFTQYFRGAGFTEWAVGLTTRIDGVADRLYNSTGGSPCGHDAGCAFGIANTQYFATSSGPCANPTIFNRDGPVSSSNYNGGWYLTDPLGAWMNSVVNAAVGTIVDPSQLPPPQYIQRE
jgi:RHS repeat-associated protein